MTREVCKHPGGECNGLHIDELLDPADWAALGEAMVSALEAFEQLALYGPLEPLSTHVPYRQGHSEYRMSVEAIARAFDVPRWLVDPTAPTPARRRAVRTAYRRRQMARRRRQ